MAIARSSEDMNALAILSLVASDFSYKPADSIRAIPNPFADTLRSFQDSAPGSERDFPINLVQGLPNGVTSLTHRNVTQGYPTTGTFTSIEFDNWVVQKTFEVRGSGFGAVVFRSRNASPVDGKFEYLVAFRGTQGPNAIDWYANLDLAKTVWGTHRQWGQVLNLES